MNGASHREKPLGVPRFLRVMAVWPSAVARQAYLVSMGNGPSAVRITNRPPGTHSRTSQVLARRRPRKCAKNAMREPTRNGGSVFHSIDVMFAC
jgi:hypothetical protein